MKRRLIIARAMMHKPPLLILDEPTAGVDVELRKTLWKYLRELNDAGTTVLLTTHYIEEAELLCDRIAIINHGKVIAQDKTRAMVDRLQFEVVVLHTKDPVSEVQLASLQALDTKRNADGRELTLSFDKHDVSYQGMLDTIREAGIEVVAIKPADNRLEQVFLQLTKEDA